MTLFIQQNPLESARYGPLLFPTKPIAEKPRTALRIINLKGDINTKRSAYTIFSLTNDRKRASKAKVFASYSKLVNVKCKYV